MLTFRHDINRPKKGSINGFGEIHEDTGPRTENWNFSRINWDVWSPYFFHNAFKLNEMNLQKTQCHEFSKDTSIANKIFGKKYLKLMETLQRHCSF